MTGQVLGGKCEEYQCASCGGTFKKRRNDEAAMKEYRRDFPGCTKEEREIVCHDCWKRMTKLRPPLGRRVNPIRLLWKRRFRLLHPIACYKARKWLREAEAEILKRVEKDIIDALMFGRSEKN